MTTQNLYTLPANTRKVRFTYAKPIDKLALDITHREILMGREAILPLLAGGRTWGRSNTGNRFVTLDSKPDAPRREYLQGVEVQPNGRHQIKRFDSAHIYDLEVVD